MKQEQTISNLSADDGIGFEMETAAGGIDQAAT
jgi:hypothetical protein